MLDDGGDFARGRLELGRVAAGGIAAVKGQSLVMAGALGIEIGGRQLAERALQILPKLKILYTTGYTRNAIVHNGMLDVGTAVLPKPFTIDQLAAKVRQVLDS